MITLWHNPRCSKSRAALKLLEDRAVPVELRLYLKDPPSRQELQALQTMLVRPAAEMMRLKEPRFRELGLSREAADAALLDAMAEHPVLIERPVAIRDGRAVIGRPPERVLELL